jgi:hypothetical protein
MSAFRIYRGIPHPTQIPEGIFEVLEWNNVLIRSPFIYDL